MIAPVSWAALALAVAAVAFVWRRKAPVVTGLTLANFIVFVLSILTGAGRLSVNHSPLLTDLSVRPADFSADGWTHLYGLVTATLLHADAIHIIGNTLVLLLVGLPFEERVGRTRFLAVYLFGAVTAVILHSLWVVLMESPEERLVPLVGASGAVFGVLGAFATMYPLDRIMLPLGIIILPRVPVYLGALVLTGIEMISLFSGGGNVAHAAHIGGAVGGVILGLLFRPRATSVVEGPQALRRVDYPALERLARDARTRGLLEKLKENEDHPDTQRAWLERILPDLACPTCGQPFAGERRGLLVCPNGHEERYAL